MSFAYPWVEGPPWPDKELPREQLEDHIQRLLAETNMCVLATIGRNGPIASPIEYYADGMDIYVLPDPGTPKLAAMQRDSRISLAVHREYHGWHNAHGLQYFGQVEVIEPDAPGWDHAMKVFRWHGWMSDLGMNTSAPFKRQVAKIVPERILYTETWLWKQGYGAKQVWQCEG
ncbi:MAG: pyridoxamine 5'-phosphate oxidase family protein [Gammaproteobacteria bacterium]|jgi:nitroimidazol reductase NimA-like FMN-containing flavoprotein (pyridoxamine 5'-phosphate oxidase superfamily)|nr:hypothetical protein [Gammaproteobacteria bacterium]MDP7296994.1 pyridoxamine 5'-phosphate oxidase family protein [Gammaproteobacteria bacterium]MDP7419071.1 pyridoxamine 5'-phosphate oxidase family protein [Gammaproteobacteria bacterium]MDP7660677.1 pyridoxamine 5'-phosphate oxidase family protein [Gammaproteobacteria bacterium]HJP38957.1 pyridoxamine 5'-phosphate oxidase family protein [Gammaproteobacteria bacterium]